MWASVLFGDMLLHITVGWPSRLASPSEALSGVGNVPHRSGLVMMIDVTGV